LELGWSPPTDRRIRSRDAADLHNSSLQLQIEAASSRLSVRNPNPFKSVSVNCSSKSSKIETAFDELKTHLRGAKIVLRSKTPDLVRQEFYGLLMAHFAIRGLMHEAALKADEDPDRLAFLHAVRVVRRKLQAYGAIPPCEEEGFS
jgi:hypothetical protein